MQTTAINQAAAIPVLNPQAGVAASQVDFNALIMQMMGGQTEGGTGYNELLAGILGDSEDQDTTSTDYAMQMLSGMLIDDPTAIPEFDFSVTQSPLSYKDDEAMANVAALAAAGQSYTPSVADDLQAQLIQSGVLNQTQLLEQLTGGTNTASYRDIVQQLIVEPEETTTSATNATQQLAEALAKVNLTVEKTPAVKTAETTPVIDPLQNAYQRIYKLKPVKEQAADQTTDTLARQAQSIDPTAVTNVHATERAAEPHTVSVMQQVRTGIIANLDSGKAGDNKEFVIKLKPEGLGDITVKMVESEGKISLSITTSTQQAQTALTGELASLKEALRPYNAEVQQVITQEQSMQQGYGEHKRNGQEQQQPEYRWDAETDTQTAEDYTSILSSALNAYI